jgi:hypothetical protein
MIDLKAFNNTSSKEIWDKMVEKTLKKAAATLPEFSIEENISIEAYSKSIDVTQNHAITTPSTFCKISQAYVVIESDLLQLNSRIKQALESGVSSIRLEFSKIPTQFIFNDLLKDIYVDMISIHILIHETKALKETITQYHQYITNRGIDSTLCEGSIIEKNSTELEILDLIKTHEYFDFFPKIRFFELTSDQLNVQNSIAEILHKGHRLIFEGLQKGLSASLLSNKIQIIFPVKSSFIVEAAKLKTIRILWQRIIQAYNQNDNNNILPIYLLTHSDSTAYFTQEKDTYLNLLHQTSQALGSIIGTADEHFITPFDFTQTLFSERISRNILHLLKEESYLENRKDPLKGAYSIEVLIDQMTTQSWKKFLQLEHNK